MSGIDPPEKRLSTGSRARLVFGLAAAGVLIAAGLAIWFWQAGPVSLVAGDRFAIEFDPASDLTSQDRQVTLGDLQVLVSMGRPARALAPIPFRVVIRTQAGPLSGLRPELAFNMQMDMGRLAYRMLPDGAGYRAEVTLPVCLKGGKRWFARLRFEHAGQRYEKVLLFDLL